MQLEYQLKYSDCKSTKHLFFNKESSYSKIISHVHLFVSDLLTRLFTQVHALI